MNSPAPRRRSRHRLLACAGVVASAPVLAAGWQPDSGFLQFGATENDTRAFTAGFGWDWPRTRPWWGGELGGYWEVALSHWSTPGPSGRQSAVVTQFGVKPALRWRPSGGASPWFVEGGIGFTVMTPVYENKDKRFSTAFNFADHVALGRSFGPAREHEVALRFEHFSNGGLRKPNPGENFYQLRYTRRF